MRGGYLEGDNLGVHVLYYLNVSEIWPGKRGGLLWEGSYNMGWTVTQPDHLIVCIFYQPLNIIVGLH
jgi:hypothetical protein